MKDLTLLTWLTQLGLSVAVPIAGFVFLGVWLRQKLVLGVWVIVVGAVIGLVCAASGLCSSLKQLARMADTKQKDKPVSFNDHD